MRTQLPEPRERDPKAREQLRARLAQFRGSRQRNILGLPEIIALVASGVLFVAALFSYFYFLLPQRTRLQRAGEERTKLQNELRLSTEGIKESESTQASVEEILKSLEDFENRHLVARNEATTAVIEELNTLIRRNRLSIATGVSFTQLDEAPTDDAPQDGQQTQQTRRPAPTGIAKSLQSVFPGIAVSLTVEGSYPNLRRFIRDIEADRRFIVINTVELEGITDAGARAAAAASAAAGAATEQGGAPSSTGGRPPAAGGATLVSLRLDLAAYFRRTNATTPG
ncbi:MAG TPA: GspMb/PilO family protein [Pyrinomonadaceae bacterium]|jgi:hypothetical protein